MDGNGNFISSDKTPTQAAWQVLPRFFGSSNPAVEAIFKGWTAYRKSKIMWRPNPVMPEGDVTPDECIRAHPAERLSVHRPFLMVGATLPRNPVCLPAAEHVDQKEFPALEPSPKCGHRGHNGFKRSPESHHQRPTGFSQADQWSGCSPTKRGSTWASHHYPGHANHEHGR